VLLTLLIERIWNYTHENSSESCLHEPFAYLFLIMNKITRLNYKIWNTDEKHIFLTT